MCEMNMQRHSSIQVREADTGSGGDAGTPGRPRHAWVRVRSDRLAVAVFAVPIISVTLLVLHVLLTTPVYAVSTLHCQVVEMYRHAYLTGREVTRAYLDSLVQNGTVLLQGNTAQLLIERSDAFVIPSLMSLMSAISPQMHLMKLAATMHALPRLVLLRAHHQHTQQSVTSHAQLGGTRSRWLCSLNYCRSLLGTLEMFALMGILFVSPSQIYKVYQIFLRLLVWSCMLHMLADISVEISSRNQSGKRNLLCCTRVRLFIMAAALLLTWNFSVAATSYCQQNVYRIAGVLEYLIFCCIMGYHYLATDCITPGELLIVVPKDKYM